MKNVKIFTLVLCLLASVFFTGGCAEKNEDKKITASQSVESVSVNDEWYAFFKDYLKNTLLPNEGSCDEFDITVDSNNTDVFTALGDKKGVCSAFIKDLNGDSVREMITVSVNKGSDETQDNVFVDVYSTDGEIVEWNRIYSCRKFGSGDERVYIYTVTHNDSVYIVVAENVGRGSVFGSNLSAFKIEKDCTVNKNGEISFVYSHGDQSYIINGEEYQIESGETGSEFPEAKQKADEKANDIFKKLGVDGLSINEFTKFPDDSSNVEKIFSCGTQYVDGSDNSFRAYLKDYTDLRGISE